MKTAVYAATDVAFDTKSERVLYPKGSLIQIENLNGDIFVVHHKLTDKEVEKGGKKETEKVIETKLYKFLRMEDLKFALDAVIFDSQLSDAIDFRDVSLTDTLLSERIPPGFVLAYTVDETSPFKKKYEKEGKEIIRLPVRTRVKEMSSNDKIKELAVFDENQEAFNVETFEDITSVTARVEGNTNQTGYLIHLPALNDVRPYLPNYLESKLREGLPEDFRILRVLATNEDTGQEERTDTIRIYTNGAPVAQIEQFLSTLPLSVMWQRNEQKEAYEIDILENEPEEVVETFFTREVYHENYTLLEGEGRKEGSKCVNEAGDVGVLVKQDDKLVCLTKESFTPDFNDYVKVGDPCQTEAGISGTIQEVDGSLACVCKTWKETDHEDYEFNLSEAEKIAGAPCKKGDMMGTLQPNMMGKLVCKVAGQTEIVGYIIPKIDEAESYDGYPLSPGSSPKVGDDCLYQGKPGKLVLINGALICALGGTPPKGSDGAN